MSDNDTVTSTCSYCHCQFEQLRWQFEIDVQEEGEYYEPVCPECSGSDPGEPARILAGLPEMGDTGTVAIFIKRREAP